MTPGAPHAAPLLPQLRSPRRDPSSAWRRRRRFPAASRNRGPLHCLPVYRCVRRSRPSVARRHRQQRHRFCCRSRPANGARLPLIQPRRRQPSTASPDIRLPTFWRGKKSPTLPTQVVRRPGRRRITASPTHAQSSRQYPGLNYPLRRQANSSILRTCSQTDGYTVDWAWAKEETAGLTTSTCPSLTTCAMSTLKSHERKAYSDERTSKV